jgi:urease accessory protein
MRGWAPPRGLRAVAALWLLTAVQQALAHASNQRVGDFYAGLLHPVTALEHILPFLALGMLASQRGGGAQGTVLAFTLALMAGAGCALAWSGVPGIALLNLASSVVLGAMLASAYAFPVWTLYVLAVLIGLSHGYANGEAIVPPTKAYLFIPGVGLAGLMLSGYALIGVDWLLRRKYAWLRIAVRVVGSWIAAIGILVLAASARTLIAS